MLLESGQAPEVGPNIQQQITTNNKLLQSQIKTIEMDLLHEPKELMQNLNTCSAASRPMSKLNLTSAEIA
jgi:hypothetical protein